MANTNPEYVNEFWAAYGDDSILVEIECIGPEGSLAYAVLDTFNIPIESRSENIGGNLYGLDIKHMDAMAVINLSLLEALAETGSFSGGTMYEPIVNPDGEVEFIKIGDNTAYLRDIYYQVQSSTFVEECKGVLVRGGKIMPTWRPPDWKPIWGENGSKLVIDNTAMATNCLMKDFSTHATIIFNDPHLDSTYNDGINNLYEVTNPYEKIAGYAYFINSKLATDRTRITWSNSSIIPIVIGEDNSDGFGPYMGTLIPRPLMDVNSVEDGFAACWRFAETDETVNYESGVLIPIPEQFRYENIRGTVVDKFQKVEEVLIVARELSLVRSAPLNNDAAAANVVNPGDADCVVVISMDNPSSSVVKLEEGKHYALAYDEENNPYVVFAKDARINEPKNYGMGTNYIVGQYGESGLYEPGKVGTATIFPVAENKGYIVEQIIALVSVDSPSINIYDPAPLRSSGEPLNDDSKASEIANTLEYVVTPIIIYEPESLIAFNGRLLDQTQGIQDNDPTTQQDFSTTELEKAYDELDGGGGLEITLPFFNDEADGPKLEKLSETLYEFMNNGTGIETTYVCGPNTEVELGERGPSGGIVNSISYSYTDSGSYTISVNEGPRLVKPFSGGGPAGPSFKATESFNARGTIIENIGNGIHFKVRIDGYGERVAINMSQEILRVGDVVSCSVHNNPVEA